eukprot:g24179.t1
MCGIPLDSLCDNKTTSLDLSSKGFGPAEAAISGEFLKVNKVLQHLSCSNNRIGADGVKKVAAALKDHPSITSVDLRDNKLSVESGLALAVVAKQNHRIKQMCGIPLGSLCDNKTRYLYLSSESVGPTEAVILAEFLKVNNTLTSLNLNGNAIGDAGAQAIGEGLQENKECKLETLDISDNAFGPKGAAAIAAMLMVNQSIERIGIQGNYIPVAPFREGQKTEMALSGKGYDNLSAIIIASLLLVNKSISVLELAHNKLGSDGAAAIGKALQDNKVCKLESLDISANKIGEEGAQHMAKALEVNKSLKELILGTNGIGPESAKAIAAALEVNTVLQQLGNGENRIGNEGARAFAAALKVNKTLKTLSLGRNNIWEQVATHIASALKVNTTLLYLNISENRIGSAGAQAIIECLKVNHSLETLTLDQVLNQEYWSMLQRNREWKKLHQHAQSFLPVICDALHQFTPEWRKLHQHTQSFLPRTTVALIAHLLLQKKLPLLLSFLLLMKRHARSIFLPALLSVLIGMNPLDRREAVNNDSLLHENNDRLSVVRANRSQTALLIFGILTHSLAIRVTRLGKENISD